MFSLPGFQRTLALQFGRRQPFTYAMPSEQDAARSLTDDAKLFLTTFGGGLLFMTIYLA